MFRNRVTNCLKLSRNTTKLKGILTKYHRLKYNGQLKSVNKHCYLGEKQQILESLQESIDKNIDTDCKLHITPPYPTHNHRTLFNTDLTIQSTGV